MKKPYYDQVRAKPNRQEAWRVICRNGIRSKSAITRKEILEFSEEAERNLDRIGRKLAANKFEFKPAEGIRQKKPGKKSIRPIVRSPIPNRIVQRAILQVVQRIPAIDQILKRGHNFGGVEEKGVPAAVEAAVKAAKASKYFIRTDIKSFFVNIPRQRAIEVITGITREAKFDELLTRAAHTELANIAVLGSDAALFPLEDIGVAQGSCLSPVLCNLLLADFDQKMNSRGIICIRYIDDFILFAKSHSAAFSALASANKILAELGLSAYDPKTDAEKAECGDVRNGFHFLGCEIQPKSIRPSLKSRQRLMNRIQDAFKDAYLGLTDSKEALAKRLTFSDTLLNVGNVIRGWGNTYSFCTDYRLMADMDRQIDQQLQKFRTQYAASFDKKSAADQRRLLGVFCLDQCKRDSKFVELLEGPANKGTPNSLPLVPLRALISEKRVSTELVQRPPEFHDSLDSPPWLEAE